MDNPMKTNILLVDDQPKNLIKLEAVLSSPIYNIITANSGEEALKCIFKDNFAIILLQVQMIELNGLDTARLIKQREKARHIPIILIAENCYSTEDVHQGYSIGAIDYIINPFNSDILKNKVTAFVKMYEYQQQLNKQSYLLKKRTIELRRANLQLEKMEEKSRQHNQNLERVVKEKTEELLLANKHLRLSQERFQKIFMSSPNLIAIRSLKDGRYLDANESWQNYTGYLHEEMIDQKTDLIELSTFGDGYTKDLDLQKSIRNAKIHYTTKSGQIREGLLSTELVEIQNEPCIISVITDITDIQQLEKEIARLDRLNLIGEMAAGIAHEVRNPMTTVSGFLQIAKTKDSTHLEYIDLMLDELNRANEIIKEFLSLAKDKTADRKLHNLNKIIEALYPLIQAEAVLSGKNVLLNLNDCTDIHLDEKEIRQLILNIALNGIEAMSSGGQLTMKTYIEEEFVVLEIKDEGTGIDQEIIKKIGTPFFTTKERGTGMGLAVCYSIVERHHANISIETSEKGTTFYIRFNKRM